MGRRSDIAAALEHLAPHLPAHEGSVIVDRAMDSAGLAKALPATAAWLAMTAYVRHVFTDYDALLDEGYDVDSARHFVAEDMRSVLTGWGVRRPLSTRESGEDESEDGDGDRTA